jgi:hypothetical protein
MGKVKLFLILAAICAMLAILPSGAFIGTGLSFDRHIGDTMTFSLGRGINALDTGFALAGVDMAIDWGVDYNLNTIAGYPYGFGGVGAVTAGDIGYNLGVTMDQVYGVGYDGATFGVPYTAQNVNRLHLGQSVANVDHIENTLVTLPYAFPIL